MYNTVVYNTSIAGSIGSVVNSISLGQYTPSNLVTVCASESYSFRTKLSADITDSANSLYLTDIDDGIFDMQKTSLSDTDGNYFIINPDTNRAETIQQWSGMSSNQVTGITRAATSYAAYSGDIVEIFIKTPSRYSDYVVVKNIGEKISFYFKDNSGSGNIIKLAAKPRVTRKTTNAKWYWYLDDTYSIWNLTTVDGTRVSLDLNKSIGEICMIATLGTQLDVGFDKLNPINNS